MLSMEEKVGQLMMVGFHGTTAPPYLLDWLATGRIGGVYLFTRNIDSPDQVKKLIDECHTAAKNPILVGIDQEGGIVARLREGFTESPGAMALSASGDMQLTEDIAYMMGQELLAMGINWNFAPVADITHNINNPSVGTRSAGTDKHRVAEIVKAQVRGFQQAGVAATVKHFPGLGNTTVDTHDALARISGSVDYLYEQDLIPFRGAISEGVACVMTTHVLFEDLDSEHPTTLSSIVLKRLLRDEIGYDGAVCTDCMEMKAITDKYGASESAILSVLAGVDIVLFSHTKEYQEQAYQAVLNAVKSGRITEGHINKSVARIQAIKKQYEYRNPPPLNIIQSKPHQKLAQQAANAGTVLVKSGESFPLMRDAKNVVCIEFATQIVSDAVEAGSYTGFTSYLNKCIPIVKCHIQDRFDITENDLDHINKLLEQSDTVILATRNAHMLPKQAKLARSIIGMAKNVILICLRNPYDAGILDGANTIICTNGDSTPSLRSAVDAICGDFTPTGNLTVKL
jgi:beta-N-acetylhexosaminidase